MSGWGIEKELVMKDNKGDTEDNEIGNGENREENGNTA